jgi:cardiolipin synthase
VRYILFLLLLLQAAVAAACPAARPVEAARSVTRAFPAFAAHVPTGHPFARASGQHATARTGIGAAQGSLAPLPCARPQQPPLAGPAAMAETMPLAANLVNLAARTSVRTSAAPHRSPPVSAFASPTALPGLPAPPGAGIPAIMTEAKDRGGQCRETFSVAENRLTLLTHGPERLDALVALIDGAQTSLRLLYYIYSGDASGTRVRDALLAAIGRGVRVALIVDGFGSDASAEFFAPLEQDGASVCRFQPRWGRRYLLRNHQKLALADGETPSSRVIVGGFNVADDYFSDAGDRGWRDLGLLVEGPAAARLAGYFDALAEWTATPKARMRALRRSLDRWSEPNGPARWLLGGPARQLSPWARGVRADMRAARRLDMIAAYFAPNPMMLRAVEMVVRRGGVARVLTAAKSDNTATIGAARHTYRRLLRRGVRIFEYQPAKLHTKLFVVDDVVHIGSANFDIRSLYLNLEIMLRIEDRAFADHLRDYFAGELAQSVEVTRAEHRKAGLLDRLRWSLAYFVVAIADYGVTRRLNFGIEAD